MPDIQAGEVFTSVSPGKSVTPGRLNNHVNGATILPAFIFGKAAGTPALTDLVVWCDATGTTLKKVTLANLFGAQNADAAAGTASLRTLGNTGNKAAPGATTPGLTFDNDFTGRNHFAHINTDTNPPAITAGAALGAGGTATLAANSGDLCGQVTLTPAGVPTANAKLFNITFNKVFVTNPPIVILVPYGINAVAAMQGTKAVIVNPATLTTAQFEVNSNTTPLTAGTVYIFNYLCIG
jgi:hypothetical protein